MRNGIIMVGSVLLVKAPLRDIPYYVTSIHRPLGNRSYGLPEVHVVSETGIASTCLLREIEQYVAEGRIVVESPSQVDLRVLAKLGVATC